MEPKYDITNTPIGELYRKQKANDETVGALLRTDTEQEQAQDRAGRYYETQSQPINESDIRQRTLDTFQREIDATNAVYGDMLRQVQRKGQENLGQSGAIQARSGLLGSDFGAAQTKKVESANIEAEQSVEAERLAKIAEIMGEANTLASAEIESRRKAQQEGLDSYLQYQATKAERKTKNLGNLVASLFNKNVDPSTLTDEQKKKLATSYGVSTLEIDNAYLSEKKAREEAKKKEIAEATKPFELGEGQRRYSYNPATGKYELQAYNPKTFAPEKADGTALTPEQTKTQIGFLKDTVKNALALKDAAGRSGFRRGVEAVTTGATDFTQLESYLNTLKTNLLTLQTDPTIKKFFGPQMSNNDVKLMLSAGSTLDAESNRPDQIVSELGRITDLLDRMDKAVPGGIGATAAGTGKTEEQQLAEMGYTPEQIQAIKNAQ